jgi:hypothetical protein
MEMIFIAVIIGLIPAVIAYNKGKSFLVWWLFGAALFIVALPMSILAKPEDSKVKSRSRRKCPYCAELVKIEAAVCRYCGNNLPNFTDVMPENTVCPNCNVTLGLTPEAKIIGSYECSNCRMVVNVTNDIPTQPIKI